MNYSRFFFTVLIFMLLASSGVSAAGFSHVATAKTQKQISENFPAVNLKFNNTSGAFDSAPENFISIAEKFPDESLPQDKFSCGSSIVRAIPPVVEVDYPDGGETLSGIAQIRFNVLDNDTSDLKASIYYYRTGGSSEAWAPIITEQQISGNSPGVPEINCSGSGLERMNCVYSWNTLSVKDADDYIIIVSVSDAFNRPVSDQSDSEFKIRNSIPAHNRAPAIQYISPAPDETISGNYTIEFMLSDPENNPMHSELYYSRAINDSYSLLENFSLPGNCTEISPSSLTDVFSCKFAWNTLSVPDGEYALRVLASDRLSAASLDSSAFTIMNSTQPQNNAPDVLVARPNGGEILSGASLIQFFASDSDIQPLNASISLYDDSSPVSNPVILVSNAEILGGNETEITCLDSDNNLATPNLCAYNWDTLGHPNGNNYRIIVSASDGTDSGSDISDSDFEIYNSLPAADTTPPITTTDYHSAWRNIDANIGLFCSDSQTGCLETRYRLDTNALEGINFASWQPYVKRIIVSSDGNYALEYYSVDNNSNSETPKRTNILIDKVNPTVQMLTTGGSTTNTSITITYLGSDDRSGISHYFVRVDSNLWAQTSSTSYTFNSQSIGTHTYEVVSVDAAGNGSSAQSVSFTITQSSGPYCGDGVCNNNETCTYCPGDCGGCSNNNTNNGGTPGGSYSGSGGYQSSSCSASNGYLCSAGQTCNGNWIDVYDTEYCCSVACEITAAPSEALPEESTEETNYLCGNLNCDDTNPCTFDMCHNGECLHKGYVNNGLACGTNGTCKSGECVESESTPPLTGFAILGLDESQLAILLGMIIIVVIAGFAAWRYLNKA